MLKYFSVRHEVSKGDEGLVMLVFHILNVMSFLKTRISVDGPYGSPCTV